MRVAALYDIHGNLPALEAALEEIRQEEVDHIVIGGDVVPGPMPCQTLACLLRLGVPMQFIHGNGELAVLAQHPICYRFSFLGGRRVAPPAATENEGRGRMEEAESARVHHIVERAP